MEDSENGIDHHLTKASDGIMESKRSLCWMNKDVLNDIQML